MLNVLNVIEKLYIQVNAVINGNKTKSKMNPADRVKALSDDNPSSKGAGLVGAGGFVPRRVYKWHHGLFPASRRAGGRGLRATRLPSWIEKILREKK